MAGQKKCRGTDCRHYELGELAKDLVDGRTILPCGIAGVLEVFAKALREFEQDVVSIDECRECSLAQRAQDYRYLLVEARKRKSLLPKPSYRKRGGNRGKGRQSA